MLPLDYALSIIVGWLAIGLLGLLAPLNLKWVSRVLFPLGAVLGLALALCAWFALSAPAAVAVLALGLPQLPVHVRLDALSAFFLLVLGLTAVGVSLFSAGYFRRGQGTAPGLLCLQYHLFLAAMAAILVADDGYGFMLAWETMALASYFLVTSNHRLSEIRGAGFLYLLLAHIGAIAILLCFAVMQGDMGDYTFAAMRASQPSAPAASAAFVLALLGFGAKAGLLPLHAWLPEAHPAAPSPVSALMSGMMLKTAVYGVLRVCFDLLDTQQWWWGALTVVLGLLTALFGVLFAAVQTDMKRLLAYSSIENIGVIFCAVGLSILFHAFDRTLLAALALAAALYHALNHAMFKSLLFLATGAVLHATQERNLGRLGGLARRMPWVAALALIGTLAIAGLPPLNGFASEWMLLQVFLLTAGLPYAYLNMLIPIGAAALVLAAGLAGYVMVKFYGIVFLGQPREEKLSEAHDAGALERAGMSWLALACIAFGLAPTFVLATLDPAVRALLGGGLDEALSRSSVWLLAPMSPQRASYSPLAITLGIVALLGVITYLVRRLWHGRSRRAPAWDCGFPQQSARMQDTAEGFGQPIKQIFESFFRIRRELPRASDPRPRYRSSIEDPLWYALYAPVNRLTQWIARGIGALQHGRIHLYLLYSFVTLLALLAFV